MNKKEMLQSIENYLSKFGPINKKILEAINKIDRKKFYPIKEKAYLDIAQPIIKGQTISQPSTVARMLDLLDIKQGQSILEIGTGSGWNAALLAFLAKPGKVLSLEFHKELIEKAKKNIQKLKLDNLEIKKEDFKKINLKFDRIIFTCGIDAQNEKEISEWINAHLKKEGRAICPYKTGPLILFKKSNTKLEKTYTKEEYCFVPLQD